MDNKLILKLDKTLIENAKKYASSNNRSLSSIIESYLQSLTVGHNLKKDNEIEISPFVKSMFSGVKMPVDLDYKTEYANYLSEKYK